MKRRSLAAALMLAVTMSGCTGGGPDPAPTQTPSLDPSHTLTPEDEPLATTQTRLDEHATALLAGDLAGWLAIAHPDDGEFRAELEEQFDYLRQLKLSGWMAEIEPGPLESIDGDRDEVTLWTIIAFCAQTPTCPSTRPSRWIAGPDRESYGADLAWERVDGRWYLTGITTSSITDRHPFVVSRLRAVSGPLVTLLAPVDLAVDLDRVLEQAEAAAAHVHSAVPIDKPRRYVVYIAGQAQWYDWFGIGLGVEAFGFAPVTSPLSTAVMIHVNMTEPGTNLDELLRHEMTHAATLFGRPFYLQSYLNEGIAEYVANSGKPISAYPQLPGLPSALDSWNDDLDTATEFLNQRDRGPAYILGFLTLHCVAETWGEAAMWRFYDALADNAYGTDVVDTALGQPWDQVEATCVDYIHAQSWA